MGVGVAETLRLIGMLGGRGQLPSRRTRVRQWEDGLQEVSLMHSYDVEIPGHGVRAVRAADAGTAAAEAVREVYAEIVARQSGSLPPIPTDPIRVRVEEHGQAQGEFDVAISIDGFGTRPTVRTSVTAVRS